MKQEFEMSEAQLQAIYDISRNQTPVIYVGVWLGGESLQENANKLWQTMADEMGFIWDSVEWSAKGKKFFLATPKEKVKPKTQTEIEIDKYVSADAMTFINPYVVISIQAIIKQLEKCDYENEAGYLKNNIAFLALKKLAGIPFLP